MNDRTSAFPMTRLAFRGIERAQQGRAVAARSDLQQAVSCDSPTAVAWARYGLGLLAERSGRHDEARRQYRRGIDSEHPAAGPWSSLGLGLLERDHGLRSAARAPLERAASSGEAEAAARATVALAVLAEWDGAPDAAREFYRRAERSADGSSVQVAGIALARLATGDLLPPGEPDAPVATGRAAREPVGSTQAHHARGTSAGVLLGVAAVVLLLGGVGVAIALALAALAAMGVWWTVVSTAIGMALYTLLYVITRFGGPLAPGSAIIFFSAVVTTVYHLNVVHAHHPAWLSIIVGVVVGALIVGHGIRQSGDPDPSPWSVIAAKH